MNILFSLSSYICENSYKTYLIKRKEHYYSLEIVHPRSLVSSVRIGKCIIREFKLLSDIIQENEIISIEANSKGQCDIGLLEVNQGKLKQIKIENINLIRNKEVRRMLQEISDFSPDNTNEKLICKWIYASHHPNKRKKAILKGIVIGKILERWISVAIEQLAEEHKIVISSQTEEMMDLSRIDLFKSQGIYIRPDIIIQHGNKKILIEIKTEVKISDLKQLEKYTNVKVSKRAIITFREIPMEIKMELSKSNWTIIDNVKSLSLDTLREKIKNCIFSKHMGFREGV